MSTLLQDLRYALRQLIRQPSFTVVAVVTLALGIGATTAIFSVVDGVLLRPAPFRDAPRLVMVWETDRASGTTREPASLPDLRDFRARSRTLEGLAAIVPFEVNLTRAGEDPARLASMVISHEYLSLTGVQPLIGSGFRPEDDQAGGPATVLIGEDLWTTAFHRDPAVVGRQLRIDDSDRTIIGVLPRAAEFGALQVLRAAAYGRGFADLGSRQRVDLWLPSQLVPANLPRDNHPLLLVGRLAPGASVATAQQEFTGIMADLERSFPENQARGAHIESLEDVIFGPVRPMLYLLLGAVSLVLLVACTNVANLLLLRAIARTREVTVRTALGAGMPRLMRQFLAESLVLVSMGAAGGLLLANAALDLLVAAAPAGLPRLDAIGLNRPVLAVTLGVTLLVSLGFALLPIRFARRLDLSAALHQAGGRGGSGGMLQRRLRGAFVAGQLALATMLLIGAGLLIRSLARVESINPGFAVDGVLKAEYQLPASRYPRDFRQFPRWVAVARFNDALQQRFAAEPGVTGVAVAASGPLDVGFTSSIRVVGREGEAANWPEPSIRLISASYLPTMRVGVLSGRGFTTSDGPDGAPVIVINAAARTRFFGDRDPIGAQIDLWGAHRTVIGVVADEHFAGLTRATPPGVYLPLTQAPSASGGYSVLLRTSGDPSHLTAMLRGVVHDLDPELPLYGVEPLTETLGHTLAERRFAMFLLALFAGLAVVLAGIGIHGVLGYSVAQRTREIGIRVALGADLGRIRALVLREAAGLIVLGVGAGLVGALALSRLLASLLYGVGTRDPLTFGVATMGIAAVALLSGWLPARRAARIDPTISFLAE